MSAGDMFGWCPYPGTGERFSTSTHDRIIVGSRTRGWIKTRVALIVACHKCLRAWQHEVKL